MSTVRNFMICTPRLNICWAVKSRRVIQEGLVAPEGDRRSAYRIFVGNPGGNRPLGRPRRRREDNTKMDLTLASPCIIIQFK